MNRPAVICCFFASMLLLSCEKDELPVPPHDSGEVVTGQVEMGPDYGYQVFYDLGTNTVVSRNDKMSWDLGFEASPGGWHVILNTARGGAAANSGKTDFPSVTSKDGVNWQNDAYNGNLDSTAIGDYRETKNVYLIDRGYNAKGNHTGYRKIAFQKVDDRAYTIRFAKLNGSGDTTVTVLKDSSVSFVAFSFETGSTVPVEPPKEDWDLLFTQYTHVFDDPPVPYLVTGVLQNRYNVETAIDTARDFSEITYENIPGYQFSKNSNTIGYNWKVYDFDAASYTVFSNINYIIKDTGGRYYKLHFIDFYDDSGNKGAPKFEVQAL